MGLLLGLLAGVGRGLWSQAQLPSWQRQHQQLQAQQAQQTRAMAEDRARVQEAQWQQKAQLRDGEWRLRRTQLLRLHEVLAQAGADLGLRLQRWQGDEQRLQLQGWLPQAQDWPQLQARLSAAGPQEWRLHSLQAAPDTGVQLVLEVAWPAASVPSQGTRP
jgi:hypothetical protein